MDDLDYLVEDNGMDDLYLSSEMDGTHGRMAQRRCKMEIKRQMLGMILVTGEKPNSRE